MTLIDLDELLLPYLVDHPPVHLLVAGFVGFRGRRESAPGSPEALREAMAALGRGRDVHAGFPDTVILDFDRLKAASKRSA